VSKLVRTLGAVLVAAAPLLAFTQPASAAPGCSVDNTSTTTSGGVEIVVQPFGTPIVSVGAHSTSVSCSYVSETTSGRVGFSCTLAGGRCVVYRNGVQAASCIGSGNSTCTSSTVAAAGDTITLEVTGGRGSVYDFVAA
jgi:hypothetical protein